MTRRALINAVRAVSREGHLGPLIEAVAEADPALAADLCALQPAPLDVRKRAALKMAYAYLRSEHGLVDQDERLNILHLNHETGRHLINGRDRRVESFLKHHPHFNWRDLMPPGFFAQEPKQKRLGN